MGEGKGAPVERKADYEVMRPRRVMPRCRLRMSRYPQDAGARQSEPELQLDARLKRRVALVERVTGEEYAPSRLEP